MSSPTKNERPGLGLGAAAGVLMILCCAGPALIAAGVLGALGRFLGNPIVIVAAVVVAVIGVAAVVRRRKAAECCPPPQRPPTRTSTRDREVL